MALLEDVDGATLREHLADVEGRRPTMRLMVAIAYVEGVSQTDLATWYGLSRKTVYNWLQRIDEGALPEALYDEPRPGRPPKLTPEERDALAEAVTEPPAAAGYDADDWSASLLQTHLESTHEVTYSRRHCQRLLGELRG
jgi:transposase